MFLSDSTFIDLFNDKKKSFFALLEAELGTNIKDLENKIEIEIAIPGFKKDEISIEATKEFISIVAEKKEEIENENTGIKEEKVIKYNTRTIRAKNMDINSIKATYENGLLILEINKLETEENKIKINIK